MEIWPGSPTRSARPSTAPGRTSRCSPRSPTRRAVPVRRRRRRAADRADRGRRLRLARLPAPDRPRASATASACTGRTTRGRLRCNPAKLLLDPYAKAIEGQIDGDESLFSYRFDDHDAAQRPTTASGTPCSRWSSTPSSTGATTGRRGTSTTRRSSTRRTSRA